MASDQGKRTMILSELVMNLQCERMPLRLLREVMKMKRLTASILTTVFLTVMYMAPYMGSRTGTADYKSAVGYPVPLNMRHWLRLTRVCAAKEWGLMQSIISAC